MSHEKIAKNFRALDDVKLNHMAWAAETGRPYPLKVADRALYDNDRAYGSPVATLASDLESALEHLADVMPNARISMRAEEGKVLAEISAPLHGRSFTSKVVAEGSPRAFARVLLAAFSTIRPEMSAHAELIRDYVGKSAEVPPPSGWPIERGEDGLYRAISHEHELVMTVLTSADRDKVEEFARIHRWNDLLMMNCADRYRDLEAAGKIRKPAPDMGPS